MDAIAIALDWMARPRLTQPPKHTAAPHRRIAPVAALPPQQPAAKPKPARGRMVRGLVASNAASAGIPLYPTLTSYHPPHPQTKRAEAGGRVQGAGPGGGRERGGGQEGVPEAGAGAFLGRGALVDARRRWWCWWMVGWMDRSVGTVADRLTPDPAPATAEMAPGQERGERGGGEAGVPAHHGGLQAHHEPRRRRRGRGGHGRRLRRVGGGGERASGLIGMFGFGGDGFDRVALPTKAVCANSLNVSILPPTSHHPFPIYRCSPCSTPCSGASSACRAAAGAAGSSACQAVASSCTRAVRFGIGVGVGVGRSSLPPTYPNRPPRNKPSRHLLRRDGVGLGRRGGERGGG